MRRTLALLGSVVLVVGLASAAGATSSSSLTPQATSRVVVLKIAPKKVAAGKKTKVVPRWRTVGDVRVVGASLAVKKRVKKKLVAVASGKPSAKLGVGSYRVTSTVRFQTFTTERRRVPTTTPVEAGELVTATCTIDTVGTGEDEYTLVYTATCRNPAAFDGTFALLDGEAYLDEDAGWEVYPEVFVADQPTVGTSFTSEEVETPDDLVLTTYTQKKVKVYSAVRTAKLTQKLSIARR